jgi:hypothetical protein
MHVRELVELGALVAAHGTVFIQRSSLLTKRHLEQYWVASRCRQDRWARAMKAFNQCSPAHACPDWPAVRGLIQEVLASELLTRTWGAVACCHDRSHHCGFLEPVVMSVLKGHLEARHRALQLIIRGHGFSVQEGVVLNRLRRHTERWTDMLLGYLANDHDIADFAFSAQRAQDFAADLRDEGRYAPGDQPWQLAMASLRATFERGLSEESPNGDLNQRIASSILACFHSERFDAGRMFRSQWVLRLTQIADDTEGLMEDLLHME